MENKILLKQAKQYLKQINKLMNQYFIYIDDLSHERYFEYDALYKIDFEAQKVLFSLQTWCHENQIDVQKLWATNLNMFSKMEPLIKEILEKFQQTVFHQLDNVTLNRDNFEGYYYFINVYKMFIILPYIIASLMIKNNKVNFDHLAWELANYLPIFEKYDGIIERVKKYSELGHKKLLFSNFTYQIFFDVLDNLSNFSILVTIGSKESQKIVLKARIYNWKSLTLLTTFLVTILTMIIILIIKFV